MSVHLGNVGVSFRGTARDQDGNVIPVSTGDDLKILFQKPDGSNVVEPAMVVNGLGGSGFFEYVSVSGFLDQVGSWRLQGYIADSGGQWYGDQVKFRVRPIIRKVN